MNLHNTTERLTTDFKTLAHDTEALLKATADEAGDAACQARARLAAALERTKESCELLREQTVAGAKAANKVVHEHPYPVLGLAFGVGLLIGALVTRK